MQKCPAWCTQVFKCRRTKTFPEDAEFEDLSFATWFGGVKSQIKKAEKKIRQIWAWLLWYLTLRIAHLVQVTPEKGLDAVFLYHPLQFYINFVILLAFLQNQVNFMLLHFGTPSVMASRLWIWKNLMWDTDRSNLLEIWYVSHWLSYLPNYSLRIDIASVQHIL